MALSFVLNRLNHKMVFIVLDNVNAFKQLEYLLGEHDCLRQGSRVIVTSKAKHVFSEGADEIYKAQKLSFKNSIQLFSLNAFNRNNP